MCLLFFSRIAVATFKDFIHQFLEVYFDDLRVYGLVKYHIDNYIVMLDRCIQIHISLNLKKCILCAPFSIFLGHVVCRDKILMDTAKIAIIVDLPPPTSVKQLRTTLG